MENFSGGGWSARNRADMSFEGVFIPEENQDEEEDEEESKSEGAH